MSGIEGNSMHRGILMWLLRDSRGATLPIVASAILTLMALIGGGVDMSRIYLTKARLQQACDAGALAGRKAMGVSAWSTGTGSPNAVANAMFSGNFQQGDYGTGTLSQSYSESNGDVSGTASAVVPMAIMSVFGMGARTISVTCTAKMAIPNTDVMFVLDTTGSMSQNIPGDTVSKISGLKKAVKCFYEALEKVNITDVTCGNDPTATSYTGTAQIRFGFVPYSVNVNVGRLLPTSYMANSWTYDSRAYSSGSWTYKPVTFDISSLKNGTSWNNSVNLPVGSGGSNTAVTWDGCIEERQTHQLSSNPPTNADWQPIPSDAYDMNIDMLPTSTSGTMWGPLLDGATWARYEENCYVNWRGNTVCNLGNQTTANVTPTSANSDMAGNPSSDVGYYCPVAARTLQSYTTSSGFRDYVNSLSANGNTYHDIGMLWGARLISPTGLFASTNNNLTNIQRHIIFMTDGDMNACSTDYTAYGMNWWARRQLTYAPVDRSNAGGGCGDSDISRVDAARLQALCTAVKNMNITLWVIAYGNDVTSTTALQSCASTGKYFNASSSSSLISQFQQIASAISQLRLTS